MASPASIRSVSDIIRQHLEKEPTIVILSAFGGATNDLLRTAELAAREDETYRDILERLEKRHMDAVRELIPIQQQSGILSRVKRNSTDWRPSAKGSSC